MKHFDRCTNDIILYHVCASVKMLYICITVHIIETFLISKNRSTEGCSKLKSPETRQVQEIFVSTLEHLQVPKWDRTRCPEE